MGTHTWWICMKVEASDGIAVGRLGPRHKTFVPYPGLMLAGYGIYRHPDQDRDPEVVQEVVSVNTPSEDSPDHFEVHLDSDPTQEPLSDALSLYSSHWEWTFYPLPKENP